MLHDLLRIWFQWVESWGYWGIFILMAMESSIIPVPSEIVMPPAAFWASQGRLDMTGVILAGTFGSYFGSAVSYWASLWLGRPLILRYGKLFRIHTDQLEMAEGWINRFGASGVFGARLLPVVRHLISIPAGILRMPFFPFSLATLVGAGLWCTILSWFGQQTIGAHPELLQSPEAMIGAIKDKMHWFLAAVLVLGLLYGMVLYAKKKKSSLNERSKVSV